MRKYFILLILVCSAARLCALEKGPNGHFDEWGGVRMEELKMAECSFEKNADALLLLDLAQVYYSGSDPYMFTTTKFRITTAYYQRFKVFTDKGTRRANVKHTLRISSKEELKNIKGVSYNLVGGVMTKTELAQSDIHITKLNEYENQVSFSVPGVRAGTVFELGYEREQDVSYTLPSWYFSSDIPSEKSSITVGFIDPIAYYVDKHILDSIKITETRFKSAIRTADNFGDIDERMGGVAITYTMTMLKPYKAEPFANAGKNYMSWVGFQLRKFSYPLNENANQTLVNSFEKLSWYVYNNEIFAASIESDPIPRKLWKNLLADSMSREMKAKVIYEYVRNNLKWNNNAGIRPIHDNRTTWKDKTGSLAEINLLLIATLSDAGIMAYPMLTTSRYRGYINTRYPILDEYVGVDAVIVLEDGSEVVLDASSRYLPFGEPAMAQLNTKGLIVKPHNMYEWHSVTQRKPSTKSILIKGTVDENAVIHGQIDIVYTNHVAMDLIRLENMPTHTALNDYVKKEIPNAVMESLTDTIDAERCHFRQRVSFSIQAPTDNEGNVYLSLAAIYGYGVNQFINRERTADIDFGYSYTEVVSAFIEMPAGTSVDTLFKPMLMQMADTGAVFMNEARVMGNNLQWQQKLEYNSAFYEAGNYESFYGFEKKYYDMRQRPVVYHLKK